MADLAKLYGMHQNSGMEVMVTRAVKEAVRKVVQDINVNVEVLSKAVMQDVERRDKENAENMMAVVKGITPHIKQIVEQSVHAVLSELGKIEPLDELKGMVKGIRIPDHTGHLAALERAISSISIPETDLKPIQKQLDAITAKMDEDEGEEEPKKWTFTVIRDEITKLMESVEVVEE
jgi:hypothetical protein